MKPFNMGVAAVVTGAVFIGLAAGAQAGKVPSRTAKLERQVEQQKDEIELLKMRLELLEGVVKPGQLNPVTSGGKGTISPNEITYP